VIAYGAFLNVVIEFLIVAFCVFLLVKAVNKLTREPAEAPADPTSKDCPFCLSTVPIKATRCGHCTSTI
jgi:large conductance mechanosensitive channel